MREMPVIFFAKEVGRFPGDKINNYSRIAALGSPYYFTKLSCIYIRRGLIIGN